MHAHSIDQWRHEHVFLGAHHDRNERRSWAVVALCVTMMTAEIVGGMLWGSMALVADGLHMSTHAAALVIALPQVADIARSVFHDLASPLVLQITAFWVQAIPGEL